MHPHLPILLALPAVLLARPSRADEGMWTFDAIPKAKIAKYGTPPTQAWLDRVRLSSVRLAFGCSGSFVSGQGLVLTNHHCAFGCIQHLSSEKRDLVRDGFYAEKAGQEEKCPNLEVNRLEAITDVTEQVMAATEGKTGEAFNDAKKAKIASLEKACASSDAERCDVVSLYQGGRFALYRYKRFSDVRLVMAPELSAAFFGGDPDNFNFPRYNLDFSFLRVYGDDGKPLSVKHYLPWNQEGPEADELVYVTGHPGRTQRLLTVAQLAHERDVNLPETLVTLAEIRGRLYGLAQQDEEAARIAKSSSFRIENGFKALTGRRQALADPSFFGKLADQEAQLRKRVSEKPKLAAMVGDAWGEIERAVKAKANMRYAVAYRVAPRGYGSQLFGFARDLVRHAAESKKPNAERLPEYTDARLPQLKAKLQSEAPVYPRLEKTWLAFSFDKMRRLLGPDDAFVQAALGKDAPEALAEKLVEGTKLADPAVRAKLFEGGEAAIRASEDPMIRFALKLDPQARATRKTYEDEVESVIERASERIAKARFAILGTEVYPDATFSLRLSYGKVAAFPHLGQSVEPFTTFAGLYARGTGQAPFEVAPSLTKARSKLDMTQRMNFVSTNDIIGGNSGSPVIDAEGKLVGLVFDGNIYSLGGAYGFDMRVNRAVSVHAGAIAEALRAAYGAERIATELGF